MYQSKLDRIEILKIRDQLRILVGNRKKKKRNWWEESEKYGMTYFPKFEHLTKHIYISVSISSTSDSLYNTQSMWLIFTIKWSTFLEEEIMLKKCFFFSLLDCRLSDVSLYIFWICNNCVNSNHSSNIILSLDLLF